MGELDTVRTASCRVLRRMAPASATINTVVTLRSQHDLSPAQAPAMRVGWAVIARTQSSTSGACGAAAHLDTPASAAGVRRNELGTDVAVHSRFMRAECRRRQL
eukprot:5288718-Prymnesium_polylepis.2